MPKKMKEQESENNDTVVNMELIPVKGKILGDISIIRVSHSVAEQLRAKPELLKTFIEAIENDIKDHPEKNDFKPHKTWIKKEEYTDCLLCGKSCKIEFSEEKGLHYYCDCQEEKK